MMKAWFEARGYSVHIVDPVKQLLAKGGYLESSVEIEESTNVLMQQASQKIKWCLWQALLRVMKKVSWCCFGRNGSDYSAACLAACLGASVCEIWTDVDGVYTCDPRLVPDARLLPTLLIVKQLNLSYFGAKVIHPCTIGPLLPQNILRSH